MALGINVFKSISLCWFVGETAIRLWHAAWRGGLNATVCRLSEGSKGSAVMGIMGGALSALVALTPNKHASAIKCCSVDGFTVLYSLVYACCPN